MGKLMQRYDLLLDEFTFDFVNNCQDVKKLEQIIKVLRSDELGHFPELEHAAVVKLNSYDPNNILLEKEHSNTSEKVDLSDWGKKIKEQEALMLSLSKSVRKDLPDIRPESVLGGKSNKSNSISNKTNGKTSNGPTNWDKYDARLELMKMELKEERKQEEEDKIKMQQQNLLTASSNINLNDSSGVADLSQEARSYMAEKARQKGNEYFKASDFKLALSFYNASIEYEPSCTCLNNRAMTYIKMGNYKLALADCHAVLAKEPNNDKALYRRATCYKELADWPNAKQDFLKILELDSNNKIAQRELNIVMSKLEPINTPAKVKLKIEDVSDNNLPLLYYGPSYSRNYFNRERLRCGYVVAGRIVCVCTGTSRIVNPLCRLCNERKIQALLNKSKTPRSNTDPMLNGSEIIKLCKQRNTNFIIHKPSHGQNKQQKTDRNIQIKKLVSQTNMQTISLPAHEINDVMKMEVVENEAQVKCSLSQPCGDKIALQQHNGVSDMSRNKQDERLRKMLLAKEAKKRGDEFSKSGQSETAVRFYTTSINLHPDVAAYLARSKDYMNLLKFSEAVADCTEVLKRDANNVQAYLRRATAYINIPEDESSWRFALNDLDCALDFQPTDKAMRDEADALMELITRGRCPRRLKGISESLRGKRAIAQPSKADLRALFDSKFKNAMEIGMGIENTEMLLKQDWLRREASLNHNFHTNSDRGDGAVHKESDQVCPIHHPPPTERNKQNSTIATDSIESQIKSPRRARRFRDKNNKLIKQSRVSTINDINLNVNGCAGNNVPTHEVGKNEHVIYGKHKITENGSSNNGTSAFECAKQCGQANVLNMKEIHTSDKAVPQKEAKIMNENVNSGLRNVSLYNQNLNSTKPMAGGTPEPPAHNGALKNVKLPNQGLHSPRREAKSSARLKPQQPLTSSYQFYSRWESHKKIDKTFQKRAALLRSVPTDNLVSVIGEKLDGDMLKDLVESVSVMSLDEPAAAAEYLKCLPRIPRFSTVKLFLDYDDTNRTMKLITNLEKKNIILDPDLKKALV